MISSGILRMSETWTREVNLNLGKKVERAAMHRTPATALLRPGLKRLDLEPGPFPAVLPAYLSATYELRFYLLIRRDKHPYQLDFKQSSCLFCSSSSLGISGICCVFSARAGRYRRLPASRTLDCLSSHSRVAGALLVSCSPIALCATQQELLPPRKRL